MISKTFIGTLLTTFALLAGCAQTAIQEVDYGDAVPIDPYEGFPALAEVGAAPKNYLATLDQFVRPGKDNSRFMIFGIKTIRVIGEPEISTCHKHHAMSGFYRGWRVGIEIDRADFPDHPLQQWFWFHGEELKRYGRHHWECEKEARKERDKQRPGWVSHTLD